MLPGHLSEVVTQLSSSDCQLNIVCIYLYEKEVIHLKNLTNSFSLLLIYGHRQIFQEDGGGKIVT